MKRELLTMKLKALSVLLVLVFFTSAGAQTIDLELSLNQTTENPAQWSNYSVEATLTNNGPSAATNVLVDFPAPEGVVYVGANPFDAQQGTFSPYSTEFWNVGTVPAGASVTLTVNYFLLASEASAAYAQVQSASGNDVDSTPGNGTPPAVNEDDEASTEGGIIGTEFAVFGCPEEAIFLEGLASNDYGATYTWSPPTATTDCAAGGLTITQIAGPEPGGTFFPMGSGTAVAYNISDACGNEEVCVFFVFVTPEATQFTCPDDITVQATSADGAVVFYDDPTLISFCGSIPGPQDLIEGLPSGSVFPIGTTEVFRQVITTGSGAFCGNVEVCTFNVTVTTEINDLPDLSFSNYEVANQVIQAGEIISYEIDLANTGVAPASGNFSIKTYISTDPQLSSDDIQDGIIPTGNWPIGFVSSNVQGAATIPANLSPGDYFLIVKLDADEEVAESNEGNNIGVVSFAVLPGNNGDPCDNINVTVNPGSITLTNINAPIKIQKVFTPSWNTTFECTGPSCNDMFTVDGLASGTYFVQIQLFDANWGPICTFEEYVNVTGASGSSAFIQQAPSGLPVEIKSLSPNPTMSGRVEVMIYANELRQQELRCYNLLGGLEQVHDLNLVEGWNPVSLDVKKLTGGTYYLQVVGQQTRQMPTRFVVIRD